MIRHLRKLKTLGVVRLKDETYSLAKPSSGLAESLRAIILA
jgi:predicted transcriptional regulator